MSRAMKTVHLIILVGITGLPVDGQPFSPETMSRAGAPTISASGNSFMPLLSADRRYVVFLSSANNVVAIDNLAPHLDVYRQDLSTGETIQISRRGFGPGGVNADSSAPSVSSNGLWIAFASSASDLIFGELDTNGVDIYRVNADTIARSRASVDVAGNIPPNPIAPSSRSLSGNPDISADGRWIAFESFATNLTSHVDTNRETDVFLRDTLLSQTHLISVAVDAGSTANSKSELAAITPDGNYVLFSSTATNLAINAPTNGSREIYLRDVAAGTTSWIPRTDPQPYVARCSSISDDARFILYKLEFPGSNYAKVVTYDRQTDGSILLASNSHPAYPTHMSSDGRFIAYDDEDEVYLWDRQTGNRSLVSDNAGNAASHSPVISQNGSLVAFASANTNSPFQIYYRNMVTGQTRRLTENSSGGPSGKDHDGSKITVDPEGEFILFDSAEDQLVANDSNGASDIFLHTVATGETRLLSRAHSNAAPITPVAATTITNNCVSADGMRILFFSHDNNLVPGDTNGWQDAFLRDLATGQTTALTADSNGLFSAGLSAHTGILTPDGRFALLGIVTRTNQFNLEGSRGSIVRRDLETGETLVVASNLTSSPSDSFSSQMLAFAFAISDDGRRVAYPGGGMGIVVFDVSSNTQTNLRYISTRPIMSGDGRYIVHVSGSDLSFTDMMTGQHITITNRYFGGLVPSGVAFSQNGRIVAFTTGTTSGTAPEISIYSLTNRSATPVCSNCWNPSISADGTFIVYHKSLFNSRQVELKDMATGKTTLVTESIFGNGGADAEATQLVISGDGRYVVYTSKALTLTKDSSNGWGNLYVYDRLQDSTMRITGSRGNSGYGSGSTSRPVLGPDGRTLVFQSFAGDFVENDFNDTRDIFLLKLGEGDSDNDGMSDSWEQTHFSTTDRDGGGDFDQDGSSDLAEYLAGTNPANGQSVLEVLHITSGITNERHLIWSAQAGKSYRLEYKTDLQGAVWTSLSQVITATSTTASASDTSPGSERRFYRVALVQ